LPWEGGSGWCRNTMQIRKSQRVGEAKWIENSHEVVSYLKAKTTKHHASHNNARRSMNKIL